MCLILKFESDKWWGLLVVIEVSVVVVFIFSCCNSRDHTIFSRQLIHSYWFIQAGVTWCQFGFESESPPLWNEFLRTSDSVEFYWSLRPQWTWLYVCVYSQMCFSVCPTSIFAYFPDRHILNWAIHPLNGQVILCCYIINISVYCGHACY